MKRQGLAFGTFALAAWFVVLPPRAFSQDDAPGTPLEESCSNEISLFCQEAQRGRLLSCLRDYHEDATKRCKDAISAAEEDIQRKEAEAEQARAHEAAAVSEREVRLTKVEGTVFIHTSRQKPDEFIKAETGMPLMEGDLVRTGMDGKAEVTFDGHSVIELASNSDFNVNSLDPQETEFHLGIGRLVAKIQALLKGRVLSFRTPTAVAAVRGTELGVAQEETGQPSRVAVFDEGHVAVSSLEGQKEVMLGPGQETQVEAGKPPAPPRELTAMAGQKKEMAQCRQRLAAVQKSWLSQPKEARDALRTKMMGQQKPMKAQNLPNCKSDQKARSYPDMQKRQAELQQRRQQQQPQAQPKGSQQQPGGGQRQAPQQGQQAQRAQPAGQAAQQAGGSSTPASGRPQPKKQAQQGSSARDNSGSAPAQSNQPSPRGRR